MAPEDPKERFYRHFQDEVAAAQEQIDNLASLASVGGERQDAVEAILSAISRLSHEVSDASDYVPAYDQRLYAQAVKALTDKLNETQARLAPRSRFQFKSRAAAPAASGPGSIELKPDPRVIGNTHLVDGLSPAFGGPTLRSARSEAEAEDGVGALPSFSGGKNYNEEMAKPSMSKVRKPSFSSAKEIAISGQKGLHIILPSTASRATSSGRLTDMADCVVDMSMATPTSAPFANLALRDISRSLVVAGKVSGPVHITGVRDGIVVVAARQARIHECHNVDFYLYCNSHPIIEDCSNVRFAPLPAAYHSSDETSTNQWDQVDDFKWLKAEKSPNWSILPEEERLPEDVWTKCVPGEPGKDLGDILKRVGIPRSSGV